MFFLRAYTTDNRSGKVMWNRASAAAEGMWKVYLSSFGAIERYDVQVGEEITVDTGPLASWGR